MELKVCSHLRPTITEKSTSTLKHRTEQKFHITLAYSSCLKEYFIHRHTYTHVYIITYAHSYVDTFTHIHTHYIYDKGGSCHFTLGEESLFNKLYCTNLETSGEKNINFKNYFSISHD